MSKKPVGSLHSDAMRDTAARDTEYRATLERLMPYERIARLVIGLRMELGLSQEELARRVGTSASAIARLETGHHRPSVETLRRIAHAFDRNLVVGFARINDGGQTAGAFDRKSDYALV
jgi:DNA-binding XRE family transcriptional regulator